VTRTQKETFLAFGPNRVIVSVGSLKGVCPKRRMDYALKFYLVTLNTKQTTQQFVAF